MRDSPLHTIAQTGRVDFLWGGLFGLAVSLALPVMVYDTTPREVPARALPVPDTVSPQLQKAIASPLPLLVDNVLAGTRDLFLSNTD